MMIFQVMVLLFSSIKDKPGFAYVSIFFLFVFLVKIRRLVFEKHPNACKIRKGKLGWTALHYIASKGDMGAIEDVIQFCPDSVHMLDNEGHDFLDIAFACGHFAMVKKILQREDLHLVSPNIWS